MTMRVRSASEAVADALREMERRGCGCHVAMVNGIEHFGVVIGEWICTGSSSECEQLLWMVNERLEEAGYTVVYSVSHGHRHVMFRGYTSLDELLEEFSAWTSVGQSG